MTPPANIPHQTEFLRNAVMTHGIRVAWEYFVLYLCTQYFFIERFSLDLLGRLGAPKIGCSSLNVAATDFEF